MLEKYIEKILSIVFLRADETACFKHSLMKKSVMKINKF